MNAKEESQSLTHEKYLRSENFKKIHNRAECFLVWKFGEKIDLLNDAIRDDISGTWADVVMEFLERIESELLRRYSFLEEQHLKYRSTKSMFSQFSQADALVGGETVNVMRAPHLPLDWDSGRLLDIDVEILRRYNDDAVRMSQLLAERDRTVVELKNRIRELVKEGKHENECDNDKQMTDKGGKDQKHCSADEAIENAIKRNLNRNFTGVSALEFDE